MFYQDSFGPNHIRNTFNDILSSMANNPNPFVLHPDRDFTRNRLLPFSDTILLTMNLQTSSLDGEMTDFWNSHHPGKAAYAHNPLRYPTKSAFVHQRAKFNDAAFPFLLHSFNRAIPVRTTFRGYHCIAIDGTDDNIPPEKGDDSTFISFNSGKGGYHQLHITVAYHLGDKRYLDAVVQPRAEMDEKDASVRLIRRNSLPGKCLFIMDRNFDCFNVLATVCDTNQFFLVRVKEADREKSPFKFLIDSHPDGIDFDVSSEFFLSRSSKPLADFPAPLRKRLRSDRRFDLIDENDRQSVFRLPFRFIKLTLPNGNVEYLVTNLPAFSFPIDILKQLYHMRWGIETSFLFLKYGVALDHPHSIKRRFQIQEIYASLILFNFISMIVACVPAPPPTPKYSYSLNFSNAIRLCRKFLISPTSFSDDSILDALRRNKYPNRPDKNRPRKMRSQRLHSLQNRA